MKGRTRPQFVKEYVVAMLWSETDAKGEPLEKRHSLASCTNKTLEQIEVDCGNFISECAHLGIDLTPWRSETIMHDFHLTRNHHGAGFWDGDYPKGVGERLTKIAHTFKEISPYAWRGWIHLA